MLFLPISSPIVKIFNKNNLYILPLGYETHTNSSILIWLEDEWASIYPKNKKPRYLVVNQESTPS